MFREPLQLHYKGSSNQTETRNEQTTAVTLVKLDLDSLTPQLAKQLSREIHDLCFTSSGQIHDSLGKVTIKLREPQQRVTVRMALDTTPHVELAHVRMPNIVITKRGEDPAEQERKSKKVAPTAETLRATITCLMLPESSEARKWLTMMPGQTFYFAFEAEEKQLDFGPDPDESKDAGDDQGDLDLDDAPKRRRKGETTLDREGLTDAAVAEALRQVGIELKPKALAAMTSTQRTETLDWVNQYQIARGATPAQPLPAPPAYITHPKLLTEAGDVLEDQPKPAATSDVPAAPRAPRRSSKAFTNRPTLVPGKKKGGK